MGDPGFEVRGGGAHENNFGKTRYLGFLSKNNEEGEGEKSCDNLPIRRAMGEKGK